jgi:hypothetical protein
VGKANDPHSSAFLRHLIIQVERGMAKKKKVRPKRQAKDRPDKHKDEVIVRNISAPKPIPPGAIAADLAQQALNNSYDPPQFYIDQPFDCVDCGKHEIWTAAQQKWYFEVAKGSIYGRAVRCRECRVKRRETNQPSPRA